MRLARLLVVTVFVSALPLVCFSEPYSRGIARSLARGPDDFLAKAVLGPQGDGTYVVATTQIVKPAGETVQFPGRPTDLALSPDGTTLSVKTTGGTYSPGLGDVLFIDTVTREIRQTLTFPSGGNTFCGLAWSGDGQTLWTTDSDGVLHGAKVQTDGTFAWAHAIQLPGPKSKRNSAPGGLALDESSGLAYVTLSRNNTLAVVDLEKQSVTDEIPVGIAPYTVVRIGDRAYVSNWGGRRPVEGDVTGPTSGSRVVVDPDTGIASTGTVSVVDLGLRKTVAEIPVGLHPSGMAFSADKTRLFVANANSDTVSVIDTQTDQVVRTIGVKPMDDLPFGSAPNALAMSPDGKTLYVANGGNNLLAVVNVDSGRIRGLVPTGWYPGAVVVSADGATIYVANTKGVGLHNTKANIGLKQHMFGKDWHGYNTHDHMGSVTFLAAPARQELEQLTYEAACNMRLPMMKTAENVPEPPEKIVPVPTRPGEVSVFKHVLYIIKENRTYDQILGDLEQGDGDPTICMFGREVTPNHHALAEEFVLLDNFFCNGVLSADGHQWTNEGYVTDYIEKSFGGWPRSYPYEGEDALAFASSGFIWDHVLRKGLTFRDYGEFVHAKIDPPDASWSDIYADYLNGTKTVKIRATSPLHTLEPYLCPTFVGFPGTVQDVYRAREFINEFQQFEAQGGLPNFMIMLLPNDHTDGTREGFPTPEAMVADNDLALGRIVETVSHSRFWPETVIFVVEDDPQAGLDHVDSHRTVAFCISPYTKRGHVDSSHYNQTGMLRTIELIFGLAPMNQLTMAANPMTNCFKNTLDLTPYTARPNRIPLDQMNPKVASLKGKQKYYAQKSMALPLDDIDQADEGDFNRILWHAVKGYDVPYPKLANRTVADHKVWGTAEREEEDD
jgi:YVTN family beta-propeller protein